jgi:hypothetical protein
VFQTCQKRKEKEVKNGWEKFIIQQTPPKKVGLKNNNITSLTLGTSDTKRRG